MTLRKRWIRFVWRLFPTDYRRDVGISLLRAQVSWIHDDGRLRDAATVKEIAAIREDL